MWNFGKYKHWISYRYRLLCEFQYQLIGKMSCRRITNYLSVAAKKTLPTSVGNSPCCFILLLQMINSLCLELILFALIQDILIVKVVLVDKLIFYIF